VYFQGAATLLLYRHFEQLRQIGGSHFAASRTVNLLLLYTHSEEAEPASYYSYQYSVLLFFVILSCKV